MQLLKDQAAGSSDFSVRAQLAIRLMRSGNRDEALRLVDQTIADFNRQNPDGRALQGYLGFVRQLPNLDPGRFLQALDSLLPAIDMAAVNSNSGGGGRVTVGDESIDITPTEAAVIDMCRILSGRPDLTMQTLAMVPELKTKLDSLGGIDGILRPSASQGPTSMTYSLDGSVRRSSTYPGTVPRSPDLFQSLRGKALKDPDWIRGKLTEAAPGPEQIHTLITLAGRAGFEDPDLASMALELAAGMVMQVEPLQNRSQTIQSLLRSYRSFEGEVSADLLKKGFVVVQLLREEEEARLSLRPEGTNPSSRSIPNGADQLEMSLVAELALENFDGARSYVRLMPDELRLQALLRIVQNLAQSY